MFALLLEFLGSKLGIAAIAVLLVGGVYEAWTVEDKLTAASNAAAIRKLDDEKAALVVENANLAVQLKAKAVEADLQTSLAASAAKELDDTKKRADSLASEVTALNAMKDSPDALDAGDTYVRDQLSAKHKPKAKGKTQ